MESGHGPIVLFIGATLIVKLVKQTKAHTIDHSNKHWVKRHFEVAIDCLYSNVTLKRL